MRQCLEYALQVRRWVKEQGGGGLIPEGLGKPGVVHTIGLSDKGMTEVYRIEFQVTAGSGKLAMSGLWNSTHAKVSTSAKVVRFSSVQIVR
ncbi:hypothetical protein [Halomonas aerodenitrificans]|uniref:hypothetical protein n=1 Tax=Billgrantia aerodenitrificans TaxID=2733483 RepID=UPI001F449112|nr:hypothetical protein [Halomonas aerodenitrificans]